MNKKITKILSIVVTISAFGSAQADVSRTATSGIIACGGNQLIRNGGSEFHQTNYVLRNFDSSNSISIKRISVYNASGVLLMDYPETALPNFTNGVLSPQDNSLESFQTAQLSTQEFFGNSGLNANDRPIQVIFEWQSYEPVKPLSISSVRTVRDRIVTVDALGNQVIKQGDERSRHQGQCTVLEQRRY